MKVCLFEEIKKTIIIMTDFKFRNVNMFPNGHDSQTHNKAAAACVMWRPWPGHTPTYLRLREERVWCVISNLLQEAWMATYLKEDFKRLYLFNYFFNWKIIALQNFAVFCQTSTWISHSYTYIPSLLELPPVFLPIPPL